MNDRRFDLDLREPEDRPPAEPASCRRRRTSRAAGFSMLSLSLSLAALLLAGGTLVGVMFSVAAEKGGSVANSALLHTLWNLVMITDILHVATPEGSWGRPLAAVTVTRGGLLFTGGPFGVEVSLFALMGYGAVCAAILLLERGRD